MTGLVQDKIEKLTRSSTYDCRRNLPLFAGEAWPYMMTENFRRNYGCFKWAVARALQPKRILEIGIGPAVAARAFADAIPGLEYLGCDSLLDQEVLGYQYDEFWKEIGIEHVYKCSSYELPADALIAVDLVHVDAGHDRDMTHHDVKLALDARIPWILVDDCDQLPVLIGALEAARDFKFGGLSWYLFPQSYNGDLLIHLE